MRAKLRTIYYDQLFGLVLRHCREVAGLTQGELGKKLDTTQQTIGNLERGSRVTVARFRLYSEAVGRSWGSVCEQVEDTANRLTADGWQVLVERNPPTGEVVLSVSRVGAARHAKRVGAGGPIRVIKP